MAPQNPTPHLPRRWAQSIQYTPLTTGDPPPGRLRAQGPDGAYACRLTRSLRAAASLAPWCPTPYDPRAVYAVGGEHRKACSLPTRARQEAHAIEKPLARGRVRLATLHPPMVGGCYLQQGVLYVRRNQSLDGPANGGRHWRHRCGRQPLGSYPSLVLILPGQQRLRPVGTDLGPTLYRAGRLIEILSMSQAHISPEPQHEPPAIELAQMNIPKGAP